MIYTFTKTSEWVSFQAVKQDFLLQVAEFIARHGAQIAFPTLHTKQHPAAPIDRTQDAFLTAIGRLTGQFVSFAIRKKIRR